MAFRDRRVQRREATRLVVDDALHSNRIEWAQAIRRQISENALTAPTLEEKLSLLAAIMQVAENKSKVAEKQDFVGMSPSQLSIIRRGKQVARQQLLESATQIISEKVSELLEQNKHRQTPVIIPNTLVFQDMSLPLSERTKRIFAKIARNAWRDRILGFQRTGQIPVAPQSRPVVAASAPPAPSHARMSANQILGNDHLRRELKAAADKAGVRAPLSEILADPQKVLRVSAFAKTDLLVHLLPLGTRRNKP